jgi:hypothetical protein
MVSASAGACAHRDSETPSQVDGYSHEIQIDMLNMTDVCEKGILTCICEKEAAISARKENESGERK